MRLLACACPLPARAACAAAAAAPPPPDLPMLTGGLRASLAHQQCWMTACPCSACFKRAYKGACGPLPSCALPAGVRAALGALPSLQVLHLARCKRLSGSLELGQASRTARAALHAAPGASAVVWCTHSCVCTSLVLPACLTGCGTGCRACCHGHLSEGGPRPAWFPAWVGAGCAGCLIWWADCCTPHAQAGCCRRGCARCTCPAPSGSARSA